MSIPHDRAYYEHVMTTPTNDRQTSERERLAQDCERSGWLQLKEVATQLRADEAEIAQLREIVAQGNNGRPDDWLIAENDRLRAEAAQLRTDMQQLRRDLARERLTHTETAANLAAADEQARVSDEIIAALRAENEALRTAVQKDRHDYPEAVGSLQPHKSFIRSKESSRG